MQKPIVWIFSGGGGKDKYPGHGKCPECACFSACQEGYGVEHGQGSLSDKCHGDVQGIDGEGNDCRRKKEKIETGSREFFHLIYQGMASSLYAINAIAYETEGWGKHYG